MTKRLFFITTTISLLLTSCVSEPVTRGSGSSSYSATRAVEVVDGDEQTYPRIALVIGNNNYQRNRRLTNAVPDARAMRDFFGAKGFRVVYAENADKDTMNSKINEFMGGLGKKSVSVIYYSGHASQDKSRDSGKITNYLVPINDSTLTSVTDYDRDAISMNYILNKTDEINHGLNIAMLDACRTPIGRGGSGSIQNIGAEGIYLVYSTASGATASDSGQFRRSFLKYAKQPLKLTDIFGAVKLDLRKEGQRPSIQNDAVGVFYFSKPNPKPVVTPTPPPKPQIVERIVYRDRPSTQITTPRVTTPIREKGAWNPLIYRGKRSYTKNSTNTVKDNYTGLIWQKSGSSNKMKWSDAKGYCSSLSLDGYSDWRLPTEEELYYLADRTKYKPAIDTNYFSVKSKWYWSATGYKNDSSSAWVVDFDDGGGSWGKHSSTNYALCVR
jgi:hypothetical protein